MNQTAKPNWAARVARLFVFEMIVWPGLLFAGGTIYVAWQARAHPAALIVLTIATLLSIAVAVEQRGTMFRAARSSVGWTSVGSQVTQHGEDSPRPPGRGATGH